MTKKYCSIVFMHDYEDTVEGVGPVAKFLNNYLITEIALIEYLAQWDNGDESEHTLTDETPWGMADNVFHHEDYILAWNVGLAYVSLTRVVNEPDEDQDTKKPEPITLTPWEAEQAAKLMDYCKNIGDDLRDGNINEYALSIGVLIAKLKTYVKESA